MDIKDKSRMIVGFIQLHFNTPKYVDFFDYNDLGLPLAVAVDSELCTLNDKGLEVLNETYDLLCDELGADKDEEYELIEDMLDDDEDEDEE
jgi:hypothetical protein